MLNRVLGPALCLAAGVGAGCAGTPAQPLPALTNYPQPDTAIGERLQDGEIEHAQGLIASLEQQVRRRDGHGPARRDGHPKAHGCVRATFNVETDLPAALRAGVFQPGARYDALIRYSNADPHPEKPDTDGDTRGMAIKLRDVHGKKLMQPDSDEQDFLLITSPYFFIDDAARYVRFSDALAAGGLAMLKIPFIVGISGTIKLYQMEKVKIANPLETRYWSAVPYRLGVEPGAQAVKYSARPCAPVSGAIPPKAGPNFLREAMARTLAAGDACMEFLVQRRGDAGFDVEDAMTEWPEKKAPFQRVARIHIPKQDFDTPDRDAACETASFNPWHALPEHKPLGAVSRLRRVVYEAISELRHDMNRARIEDDTYVLPQGWDNAERSRFYHSPQGSPIVPYDWFLALERADGGERFAERAHLESFGLLYWYWKDDELNPDGLPVGLTRDENIRGDAWLGMNCGACHVTKMEIAGAKGAMQRVLIDGGSSHFDFWTFIGNLDAALRATRDDAEKFQRFADTVLGKNAGKDAVGQLRVELGEIVAEREAWARRNHADTMPGPGRVDALNVILNQVTAHMEGQPGNARAANAPVSYPFVWDAPYLDCVQYNAAVSNAGAGAVGRNVGQVLGVFGEARLSEGALPGYYNSVRTRYLLQLERAMESLWAPKWRDLAEEGVLPPLDDELVERGAKVYSESCEGCHKRIDTFPRKRASIPVTLVRARAIGTDAGATDGFHKRQVTTGPLQGRKAELVKGDRFGPVAPASAVLTHVVTGVILYDTLHGGALTRFMARLGLDGLWTRIKSKFGFKPSEEAAAALQEHQDAAALPDTEKAAEKLGDTVRQHGLRKDGPDADATQDCKAALEAPYYRARPLDGIWATGPYLHNGSVPTLAAMLEPDERPDCFYAGSRRFDPERVGFVSPAAKGCKASPAAAAAAGPGAMLFDTREPGNGNGGHNMAKNLTRDQKRALLEYLKSL